MSDTTQGLKITNDRVSLPRWLASILVVGAFVLGGAFVEARLELAHQKTTDAEVKARIGRVEDRLTTHEKMSGHEALLKRVEQIEHRNDRIEGELRKHGQALSAICQKLLGNNCGL